MSKARAVGAALGRMMGLMGRGSGPSRELTLDDWRDMCGEAMAAALKFQARVLELEREVAELKAQVARAGLRVAKCAERGDTIRRVWP